MAEKSRPVILATTVALTGSIAVVGNTFDTPVYSGSKA